MLVVVPLAARIVRRPLAAERDEAAGFNVIRLLPHAFATGTHVGAGEPVGNHIPRDTDTTEIPRGAMSLSEGVLRLHRCPRPGALPPNA